MIEFGHREAPGIVEWGALRERTVTVAPATANAFAVASPMPELAPVARATWPLKSRIGFMVNE
jgi:hypothetical protein